MKDGEAWGADRRSLVLTLLAIGLSAAPEALRLPAWVGAAFLCLLSWRFLLALGGRGLPPKPLLLLLAFGSLGGVIGSYGRALGRDAFLALLLILAGLKLLEADARKDRLRVLLLASFLVVCHFFRAQSILSAAYMLGVVVLVTAALSGVADEVGTRPVGSHVRLALRMVGQALPIALVLFLLFPRVQGPLWRLSAGRSHGLSGLSDSLAPGSITHLALSEEVAFRAAFDGPLPSPSQWYWRGPVLNRTDGMHWWYGATPRGRGDPCAAERRGPVAWAEAGTGEEHVSYAVTLEPHGKRWLLTLDRALAAPAGAILTPELLACAPRPVDDPFRYAAQSLPGQDLPGAAGDGSDLGAPPAGARVLDLVGQWRAAAQRPDDIVRRGLDFFREQGFVYTLSPAGLGADPLEEFLFETRQGFCEHYAAAFADLMRLAGIPARVVTGYLGGEYNPVGGYLIVRQADAHAWVEVALPGRGWTRVDPTAAVAPERVRATVDAAASVAAARVRFVLPAPDLIGRALRRARQVWDVIDSGWNLWVIGYGPRRQVAFLSRLGFSDATWRTMTALMVALVGAMLLAVAVQVAWSRTVADDPVRRLYRRYCRKLARRGLSRLPHEGPLDYARRIGAARPELESQVRSITDAYLNLRYGGEPRAAGSLRRLATGVRRFRP